MVVDEKMTRAFADIKIAMDALFLKTASRRDKPDYIYVPIWVRKSKGYRKFVRRQKSLERH